MNFPQAVTTCFKKYATFTGRAARSEYWFWVLFTVLASIVANVVDMSLFGIDMSNPESAQAFKPVSSIFSLATLVPGLAVSARRLHDTNRSGWWLLLAFTIIGIIPLIIWYCTRGNEGDNRFGSDPLVA